MKVKITTDITFDDGSTTTRVMDLEGYSVSFERGVKEVPGGAELTGDKLIRLTKTAEVATATTSFDKATIERMLKNAASQPALDLSGFKYEEQDNG